MLIFKELKQNNLDYVKFASRSVFGVPGSLLSLVYEFMRLAHIVIPSPRPKAVRPSFKSLVLVVTSTADPLP